MQFRKVIIGSLVCAAVVMLSLPALASPAWMTRPGTIGNALVLPDNTHVYLDAVGITKIRAQQAPAYLVILSSY